MAIETAKNSATSFSKYGLNSLCARLSRQHAARHDLRKLGYSLDFAERNSGPINAILFDRVHGTRHVNSADVAELVTRPVGNKIWP